VAQVEDEITVPRLNRPVFVTPSAPAPSAPSSLPPVDRPPPQESAPWLVQLELTTREFALFRGSELTRAAVAWREGMPEWSPLAAIDNERQWQQMTADSAPPPAMAISEPPRPASRALAEGTAFGRWPHSVVVVALVVLAAMLLLVWWGPVQTARDAALRAELAVQRLAPIVERALVAIEARAAEANRIATVPAGGAAARSVASSAPQVSPSAASPPPPASAAARASASVAPIAPGKSTASPVDRARLAKALSVAVARTSSCASGASGSLRAIVTFGPNGLVRAVSLGAAPSGVDRGCVSKVLSGARGRPYEGEPITIKKTIKF
jgi:hypothetical protein